MQWNIMKSRCNSIFTEISDQSCTYSNIFHLNVIHMCIVYTSLRNDRSLNLSLFFQIFQFILICIDQHNVVFLPAKHLSQMCTDSSSSGDNDVHCL